MTAIELDSWDALIRACQSIAWQDVAIVDGTTIPNSEASFAQKRLWIGGSADALSSAEGSNDPDDLPGIIDQKRFAILCTAEYWTGDIDPVTARTVVWGMRDDIAAELRPSPTGVTLGLSGLSSAYIGDWTYRQAPTDKGFYAALTFRIEFISKPSVI